MTGHRGTTIHRSVYFRPSHWTMIQKLRDLHGLSMAKVVFLALEVGLNTLLNQPHNQKIMNFKLRGRE